MTLWKTVLATMIVTSQTWAAPQGSRARVEADAGKCLSCEDSSFNRGNSAHSALMRFTQNMNAITDGALDIEMISDNMNYSNKCEQFVADGEMNKWGNVIINELETPKYSKLVSQGPRDIKQYCPQYHNMEMRDRRSLNVLILTAMAHYESSCNFREKAPGPNGTAAGLLQLHKGQEHRYSSGCRQNDSATPERTLICGLSMLNDQIERGENLFSSSSYWEVLRPRGRSQKAKKIMAAIRKFSPCDPEKLSLANAKRNKGKRVAQK